MRKFRLSLVLLVLLAVLAVAAIGTFRWFNSKCATPPQNQPIATVIKIVDGDTIDVTIGEDEHCIRLLNIDAPEIGRNGLPTDCLAEDAKNYLAQQLPIGTKVTLAYDRETTDRYGRDLAAVFLGDRLINADITAAGFAKAVKVGENDSYLAPIKDAEQHAAAHNLGIFNVPKECFTIPNVHELPDDPFNPGRPHQTFYETHFTKF